MGYKVFACARRINLIKDYSKEGIIPVYLDVTNRESVEALGEVIENENIDLLVNCAGGTTVDHNKGILNVNFDDINKDFSLNVSGNFEVIRTVASKMNKENNPLIITLTSVAGYIKRSVGFTYHLAKSSEASLMDYLITALWPIRTTELIISTVNSYDIDSLKNESMTPKDIFEVVKFICESPSYLTLDKIHLRHINSGGASA